MDGPARAPAIHSCNTHRRQCFYLLVSLRKVVDGFDVVAVGVEHERGVVVLVIVRPQAGRAVVDATRRQGRRVEGLHLGAILRREGDMQPSGERLAGADPEVRPVGAEPGVAVLAIIDRFTSTISLKPSGSSTRV